MFVCVCVCVCVYVCVCVKERDREIGARSDIQQGIVTLNTSSFDVTQS
jgi:bacterioferritin-associated ferredoxin